MTIIRISYSIILLYKKRAAAAPRCGLEQSILACGMCSTAQMRSQTSSS